MPRSGEEGGTKPASKLAKKSSQNSQSAILEAISRQRLNQKKSRTRARSRGQLVEDLAVWQPQAEYLAETVEAMAGPSEGQLRLLIHLLARVRRPDTFLNPVPVDYRLLRPYCKSRKTEDLWRPLVDAGLVGMTNYSVQYGKSRQFWATPFLVRTFLDLAPQTAQDALSLKRIILPEGKVTTRINKTTRWDRNNNAYPAVVRRGLAALERGVFYAPTTEAHLAQLRERADAAEAAWVARRCPDHGRAYEDFQKAWGLYANDRRCFDAMLQQRLRSEGGGVFSYQSAYRVQRTGRISFIGGGPQGCSQRMKAALYCCIPNVFNHDLDSAHPRFVADSMMKDGFKTDWLGRYLENPKSKSICARQVGIKVEAWKPMLLAIINGSDLPTSASRGSGRVIKLLRKAAEPEELPGVVRKLRALLKQHDFLSELSAWQKNLLPKLVAETGKRIAGKDLVVTNDAGMPFFPEQVTNERVRTRRLIAHVLQGREALFIHTLASLSGKYGFRVLANEHDGLVTEGPIPNEAVEEAKSLSGVNAIKLVPKPFCSNGTWEDFVGYCRSRGVEPGDQVGA